jgi:hypothetical protein
MRNATDWTTSATLRRPRQGFGLSNGLKLSRMPFRLTPTYQVATTAATPEGQQGSVRQRPSEDACRIQL